MKKLSEKNLELIDTAYEGYVKIDGVEAEILIETLGREKKTNDLIDFSNKFLVWFKKSGPKVKKFACKKMLKLKNKNWLEPDEKPVTAAQFIKKMELQSIVINYGKSVNLFYSCDHLFTDHGIIVEISKNFKLITANL